MLHPAGKDLLTGTSLRGLTNARATLSHLPAWLASFSEEFHYCYSTSYMSFPCVFIPTLIFIQQAYIKHVP